MNGILILLGTNLGDRVSNLRMAIELLEQEDIRVLESSSIYESEPWGVKDQPWFLNQVIEVVTGLKPQELLEKCLLVEERMGRIRHAKWSERLIDIDILFYGSEIIDEVNLKIPHPEIANRRFTLVPLAEKWGDWVNPGNGIPASQMLESCCDNLEVHPL